MHEVEHVAGAAPEAIQLHDHQFVTGADELQDRGEFVPTLSALAADLLGANDAATCCLEPGFLRAVVLIEGGDARIADAVNEESPVTLGSTLSFYCYKTLTETLLVRVST
jgi:hypothetical protein